MSDKQKPKIVLVFPPLILDIPLPQIPLGLLNIKGYFLKYVKDADVDIIDMNLSYCEDTSSGEDRLISREAFNGILKNDETDPYIEKNVERILSHNPDLVGFSIFSSFHSHHPQIADQLLYSACLAKGIKEFDRSVSTLLGGAALYSPAQNKEIMEIFPFVDFLVQGEGEDTLHSLVQGLEAQDSDFSPIPNVYWRKGSGVVVNKREFSRLYDWIPDYSEIDLSRYLTSENSIFNIELSRGCSWGKCKFCSFERLTKYKCKKKDVYHEELLHACRSLGVDRMEFVDNAITPNLFSKLSAFIMENGLNLDYIALARPLKQYTPELLQEMRQAGCRIVMWGMETFSYETQEKICKGVNISDFSGILKNADAAEIYNFVFHVWGFPDQQVNDLQKDYEFLSEHIEFIDNLITQPFRLDRESWYFQEHFKSDPARLIPIIRIGDKTLHSIQCIDESYKRLGDYFEKYIPPIIKNAVFDDCFEVVALNHILEKDKEKFSKRRVKSQALLDRRIRMTRHGGSSDG